MPPSGQTSAFARFGLKKTITDAVDDKSYHDVTPIQLKAIPLILEKRDVLAAAQTGTGKTAAYVLPLLQLLDNGQQAKGNQARSLILAPTRELAEQIHQSILNYGKNLKLRSAVVYGGVKINPQLMKLRKGVDLLVATPGRLLDLHKQNAVSFKSLEAFILDEADRMLDMGFYPDIQKIIQHLPPGRQTLLFSATFSHEIRKVAKKLLRNSIEVSVDQKNTAVKTVTHWLYAIDKKQKATALFKLITDHDWFQLLVFTKTKRGANKLAQYLDKKALSVAAIHGDKSQAQRKKALEQFKTGSVQVLVATDIAARGLDINLLPVVINFDLPKVAEDYVHRIGRTGRAGAKGLAISLVSADEIDELRTIENLINQLIKRKYLEGLEPSHELPESSLSFKPKKPKKPKKNKRMSDKSKTNEGSTKFSSGKSKTTRSNPKATSGKNRKPKKSNPGQRNKFN